MGGGDGNLRQGEGWSLRDRIKPHILYSIPVVVMTPAGWRLEDERLCVCVCVWTKSQLSPSYITETLFLLAVAHFRPLTNEPLQEPFCMLFYEHQYQEICALFI